MRNNPENIPSNPAGAASGDLPDSHAQPDVAFITRACDVARDAARRVAAEFGERLDVLGRRKIVRAFQRAMIPSRRPGRKREERITRAHEDWKNGVKGMALYRQHIPDFQVMNRYRREHATRALMSAIRSRERREGLRCEE